MLIKWWKRKREIKRIKDIREILSHAVDSLQILEDQTIIKTGLTLDDTVSTILRIVEEIDKEVDDRTRERPSLFLKKK